MGRRIFAVLALLAGAAFGACTSSTTADSSTSACADPPDKHTIVVNTCDTGSGCSHNELDLETGTLGDSCNNPNTDISFGSLNLQIPCKHDSKIVSVREPCLSKIEDPGSGYTNSEAANVSIGYVVKTVEGNTYAVGVDRFTTSAIDTVLGAQLTYLRIGGASGGGDGGGDAGTGATATETLNGTPICPLGWSQGLAATATGSTITVNGSCNGGASFQLTFSPTPPAGGSAPATQCNLFGNGTVQCATNSPSTPMGSVNVTGTTGALRASGSCSCTVDGDGGRTPGMGSVTFDLPLTVN